MGVCLIAYAVSDANIAEILADPPLVWRVVESDDESSYLRELSKTTKRSFLAKIFGKAKPMPVVRHLSFSEHELQFVDLDKSWDGLNACLKICAPHTPNFFDGEEVGDVEVGYGRALYQRSEAMAGIAAAYAGLTTDMLLSVYRTVDLRPLYPRGLWRHNDPEIESYLSENFLALQAFVQHTRDHSLGAIIALT